MTDDELRVLGDGELAERPWPDERPWPTLNDAALRGVAGDFVRVVSPHSEADPAALLLHVLVGFGALVGPNPHMMVESTRHTARLFALVVGRTASGRKGTARERAHHLLRIADEAAFGALFVSGLASGEGLIAHLADRKTEDGNAISAEKRALVQESEFARVLAAAGRDGSTLSAILRDAWDSGRLQNLTRQNPLRVEGAHVCVTGDITLDELNAKMPGLEIANGLLNRFLVVCVRRANVLPHGGNLRESALLPISTRIRNAADKARGFGRLEMTAAARAIWETWYRQVPEPKGMLGAATARAEAQALRLALTFALLDASSAVDEQHLGAAFAFWDYCFASASHVFGSRLGNPNADRLLRALRNAYPGGLTGREIDAIFGKSLGVGKLEDLRDDLERRHLVCSRNEPSGGRPTVRWFAVPLPDKPDKGGQIPQERSTGQLSPVYPVCPTGEANSATMAPPGEGVAGEADAAPCRASLPLFPERSIPVPESARALRDEMLCGPVGSLFLDPENQPTQDL
jgi:hypothetical protein